MNLLYLAIITICYGFRDLSIYASASTQKQELKLIPDLFDNMAQRGKTQKHKTNTHIHVHLKSQEKGVWNRGLEK